MRNTITENFDFKTNGKLASNLITREAMQIHPTAIIHKNAQIGEGTVIGPYAMVEEDTVIGKNCEIMNNAQILEGSRIGDNCQIHQGAILGAIPQDKKFKEERTYMELGEGSVIREYATISKSTTPGGCTKIGKNAYFMTGVHIGHDAIIGEGVTLANLVTLAGHCQIGDFVTMGGITAVHQFVRIGRLAMIGGVSGLMLDAPPFMITFGSPPAKVHGINAVGLRRNGVSLEDRNTLKEVYRILYRSKMNFSQALEHIEQNIKGNPLVDEVVDFYRHSNRGISQSGTTVLEYNQGTNGFNVSEFHSLLNVVKDENAVKEILAFIETKTGEKKT